MADRRNLRSACSSSSDSTGNAQPFQFDFNSLENVDFDLVDEFISGGNYAGDELPVLDNMVLFEDHESQDDNSTDVLPTIDFDLFANVDFDFVDEYVSCGHNYSGDVLPVLDNIVLFEDYKTENADLHTNLRPNSVQLQCGGRASTSREPEMRDIISGENGGIMADPEESIQDNARHDAEENMDIDGIIANGRVLNNICFIY